VGNERRLALHFDIEILFPKNLFTVLKNLRELIRIKPVFRVIREPCLKAARCIGPEGASAVHEFFFDASHLSDVGMDWQFGSGRKNEANYFFWVRRNGRS